MRVTKGRSMRKAKVGKFNVVFVAPGDDLPKHKAKIAPDQKVFSHDYNLPLEFFAQSFHSTGGISSSISTIR
jgi:hypothetical protein